jgi:hypothetical protein
MMVADVDVELGRGNQYSSPPLDHEPSLGKERDCVGGMVTSAAMICPRVGIIVSERRGTR